MALALGAVVADYARILWMRRRLPPGPFPWPIVGNHYQTPSVRPWIEWEKWARKYNTNMLTLWIGRHPRIILSDAWVASDLLEKKSDVLSSRPRLVVMGDAINCTRTNQTVLEYGDRWRVHRKLMVPLQLMESVNYVVPGVFLMEAIPAMLHLPSWIYSVPKMLRIGSAIGARYFYMLTEESLGNGHKAFNQTMMDAQKKHGLTDLEVAGLMGNLIGGGVDTTSSTMLSCILAMACFPNVQKKAQEEIDRVVGTERSPSWQDIDQNQLPYMTALVKEVLRWRTVTVLAGIPHANTKNVEYQGYHFPKGTNFTGNMWAIHRNPRDFPEPDNFRPERFLGGRLENPYPNARGSNPFGWGRRQCSGQPLAEQGLIFSLTRMIWGFNILPGLDAQGQPEKLDIFAYTESENTRPEKFRARFLPRTEKIRDLILEEATAARENLRVYDGETKLRMEDAAANPAMY
ncbi:cytochrome P450 [Microdochium bolleyi]|uniref:Cytochrome P450 n=1 Tax=Microdochium bolleyi TaxID=196109 RepID=A0A136IS59_9PEZI|nr:cytochrome P450 [Microdochium bolleyi]